MAGYYTEILEEIREALRSDKAEEALFLIEKELRMPYIPPETETELRSLLADAKAAVSNAKERGEKSLESLLRGLRGNDVPQLAAAANLGTRNLRACIDEIRYYLSHDPCPEAAALIVEAIAEQEIGEEFTYNRNGMIYEFWGDSVIPCAESEGYLKADRCLREWLENDNPSMLEMCRMMLTHEVFMLLPLSYEEDEGQELALGILENVSSMTDGGRTYRETLKNYRLSPLPEKMLS